MNFQLKTISSSELQNFYDNFPGEKTIVQTPKYGEFREQCNEQILCYVIT